MVYVWLLVEPDSHAMTGVVAHHAIAESLSVLRDLISDIAEKIARTHLVDTDEPCTLRHVDECLRSRVYLPDGVHARRITEVSIYDSGDVDIQDVSLFQYLVGTWDTVTDDVIERYAGIAWIGIFALAPDIAPLVVDTCRYSPALEDVCVHDLVELECRNTRLYICTDHIECLRSEVSSFSDASDLFGSFYEDFCHIFEKLPPV